MRWRAIGGVTALAMAMFCLTGCSSPSRCFPEPLAASPKVVEHGGMVTISSPKASCDLGYKAGRTYSVTIASKSTQTKVTSVPVNTDGSFSKELVVPVSFPIGTAYIQVKGSPFDLCEDTGSSHSCAGYAAEFAVK